MNRTAIALFLIAPLASCGPGPLAGESPEPTVDPVELSCANFCAVEQECGSENIRYFWDNFETAQECTDYCVWLTRGVSADMPEADCIAIFIAQWDCASALTCDEFEWFDYAFGGMVTHEFSGCAQEMDARSMYCNG